MTFLSGVNAYHFLPRRKSTTRMTVIGGYPLPLRVEMFENLRCDSGHQWRIQNRFGGDLNPLHDFTDKIFFTM